MTPTLQVLFDVSTRIREYEAAARTIEALAHLATDVQVQATLRQQAQELYVTAADWRRRQDADLVETVPSAEIVELARSTGHLQLAPSWQGAQAVTPDRALEPRLARRRENQAKPRGDKP